MESDRQNVVSETRFVDQWNDKASTGEHNWLDFFISKPKTDDDEKKIIATGFWDKTTKSNEGRWMGWISTGI